ncbi:MAG: His/Gly/Thr/Pro-type tRNA ligase C-terminal domain-containing protein [Bdellovibrionota bacterium]
MKLGPEKSWIIPDSVAFGVAIRETPGRVHVPKNSFNIREHYWLKTILHTAIKNLIVIGEKEMKEGTVTIEKRNAPEKSKGETLKIQDLLTRLQKESRA